MDNDTIGFIIFIATFVLVFIFAFVGLSKRRNNMKKQLEEIDRLIMNGNFDEIESYIKNNADDDSGSL